MTQLEAKAMPKKAKREAKKTDKPTAAKPKTAKAKSSKAKSPSLDPKTAKRIFADLRKAHPDAHCELDHNGPFQLLIATVLSAQTTDVQVNRITPGLFAAYPTADALAMATQAEVETCLNRIGMFRQKAKNIIALSRQLVERNRGEVPQTLEELILLPGVGRKTANVVLGVAFGAPEGVVVDTHVGRIAQRIGLTANDKPPEIEQDLMALFPRADWDMLSHTLIFHGRRICRAIRPACSTCPIARDCRSAFHAEAVGRKPRKI